jgi:hypothetical protein
MIVWPKPSKIAIRLKLPHGEQAKFIDSPAKRKIIRAGRRSGKTVGVSILGIQRFLAGARVLYCAPTSEQTTVFWNEVKRALNPLVAEGVFAKSETEQTIEKPDSKQRIRAATSWDPDTLRSDWCDLLILDEWQLQAEAMWSEVGAPMMLDTNGDCVFVFTPPSLHMRAISKASDPRHASKLYKMASLDKTGRWAAFHFTSHANPYISNQALEEIAQDMTRLSYRQEIEAEDIEQVQGALWQQQTIDANRVDRAPQLIRIVVAIDPSGSGKAGSDECGIIVAGVSEDKEGYILRDLSGRMNPEKWACVGVGAYHELKADRIIAEQNFGGEMVRLTLQSIDPNVPYKSVTASRGKLVRAEPVSALYDRKKIHHVGIFPELEDELCSYTGTGASPGRLDALVWAATELLVGDSQTLGWIEYLKKLASDLIHNSGIARAEPTSDTPAPVASPSAIQPALTHRPSLPPQQASPGACPACGSRCVIRASVAGGWHCNECSHNFGPAKAPLLYAGLVGGKPGLIAR